jgi:hypothetical protein
MVREHKDIKNDLLSDSNNLVIQCGLGRLFPPFLSIFSALCFSSSSPNFHLFTLIPPLSTVCVDITGPSYRQVTEFRPYLVSKERYTENFKIPNNFTFPVLMNFEIYTTSLLP